jgi:cullin 3
MDQDPADDPKGKGKAKVSSASGALASALRWVQDTLDLKDQFDRLLQDAFGDDLAMQGSINEVRTGERGAHRS